MTKQAETNEGGASVPREGEGREGSAHGGVPEFPEAEFYDCRDSEVLNHTTPEEAVEAYLDMFAERDCDMVALIHEVSPVTVTAYEPMEVTDKEIERWADDLLENLGEKWADEHGSPDDDGPLDRFPKDAEAVMLAAVRTIVRGAKVWSCKSVGSVTLDAVQVETMMRDCRADWFAPSREPRSDTAAATPEPAPALTSSKPETLP